MMMLLLLIIAKLKKIREIQITSLCYRMTTKMTKVTDFHSANILFYSLGFIIRFIF